MHIADWLPTLLSMTGSNLDILKSIDGMDQWPSLRYNKPAPRDEMLYNLVPNIEYPAIQEEISAAGIR